MSAANEVHDETTVRILSVTVDPLYPVLNEDDESPGFALPLVLFSKDIDLEHANPATIDMEKIQITFNLDFDFGANVRDFTVEGAVNGLGGHQILRTTGDHPIPDSKSVTITFAPPSSHKRPLPWGINGTITWTFRFAVGQDNTTHTFTLAHPIEIYAVTPFVGSYKTRPAHYQGMPRKALEFYLIHAQKESSYDDLQGYIRSIVKAVHADTGYAYDTIEGAAKFSGNGKRLDNCFDIGAWARHLRPGRPLNMFDVLAKEPQSHPAEFPQYIDCYDQAAAVWAGITLAFRDSKDTQNLVWHFAEPYGFIKPTRVVGWYYPDREINSPYFQKNRTPEIDNSETRTAFWNHAFLEFNGLILDATCGPHADEPLEEYLENSIDYRVAAQKDGNSPPSASNWVAAIKDTEAYLADESQPKTQEDIEENQSELRQAKERGGANYSYVFNHSTTRKKFPTGEVLQDNSEDKSGEGDAEAYIGEIGIRDFGYNTHFDSEEGANLWAKIGQARPEEPNLIWTLNVESLKSLGTALASELVEAGVKSRTPELVVSRLAKEWTHFSWTLISPSRTQRVSVDLFVLPDSIQAGNLFATRVFSGTDLPDGSHGVYIPNDDHTRICAALKGEGHGSRLCVTRNVMYAIQGLRGNGELEPYEKIVKTLFSDDHLPDDNLVEPTVKLATSIKHDGWKDGEVFECKLGGTLALEVTAPKDTLFSCDVQHKWVLVPVSSGETVGVTSATFEFRARNLGADVLEFAVCGQSVGTETVKPDESKPEEQRVKVRTIKASVRVIKP